MAPFDRLIRFTSSSKEAVWFSDLGKESTSPPQPGMALQAFKSLEDLESQSNGKVVELGKLLSPLPNHDLPIYCVGLNYRSHATEASLSVPKCPPLWTKPPAALANPDDDIILNDFCAKSLPDYEGELVFVTSKTIKDASPTEAAEAILGYTVGNDVSCRLYQLQDHSGGQFFFAKAFDGFGPIGSVLVSPQIFESSTKCLVTKVNGKIVQNARLERDMIFEPAKVLSHMSQGTTIPAFTAVMTGTPSGVGAFRKPKSFLQDGDEIEVSMEGVSSIRNKVVLK